MAVPGSSCRLCPRPCPRSRPPGDAFGEQRHLPVSQRPTAGPWVRIIPVPGTLTPISLSVGAEQPKRCWIPKLRSVPTEPHPEAPPAGNCGRVWNPSWSLRSQEQGGSGWELRGLGDIAGTPGCAGGCTDSVGSSLEPASPNHQGGWDASPDSRGPVWGVQDELPQFGVSGMHPPIPGARFGVPGMQRPSSRCLLMRVCVPASEGYSA